MSLRDTSAFKPLRSTPAYVIIAVIRGDDMLKRIKLEPNIISYTFENSSAYEMIRRNMGITIVNELGTIAVTDDLEVRQIDPPQYIVEGILIKSLQNTSPVVREFVKFIEPYIKEDTNIV